MNVEPMECRWRKACDGSFPSETMDTWVRDEYGRVFIARFFEPYGAWFSKSFPTMRIKVAQWKPLDVEQ